MQYSGIAESRHSSSVVEVAKGEFSMFAVIVDGNRQHRVQEGSFLSIDYRNEVEAGASITFDQVLLANGGGPSVIGTPTISGASVVAEVIIAQEKGIKLEIQKLRKRKNSRRHTGHRQKHTRVQIKSISVPGIEAAEAAPVENAVTENTPVESAVSDSTVAES